MHKQSRADDTGSAFVGRPEGSGLVMTEAGDDDDEEERRAQMEFE